MSYPLNTKSNLVTEWKWTSPSLAADELGEDSKDPELKNDAISQKKFRAEGSTSTATATGVYDRPIPKKSYKLETIYKRHSLKKRSTPPRNTLFNGRKQSLREERNLNQSKLDKLSQSTPRGRNLIGVKEDYSISEFHRANQSLLNDIERRLYDKKNLRKELCRLEDLNEMFAEKFYLTNWNEYCGRPVIATTYMYMLLSLIMLGISVGLYVTIPPSDNQLIVQFHPERDRKWHFIVTLCSSFNLVNSLLAYFVIVCNFGSLIDYIIHSLGLTVVALIALSFMSSRDSAISSPNERDFQSFFIASSLYQDEPEIFDNVWPNLDPNTLLNIQSLHSCCGYSSVENWHDILEYEESRRRNLSLPPSKITIPPSCCIKERISSSTPSNYCVSSEYTSPCENFMKNDLVLYESWDLRIFCGAFAFLLTMALIGLNYMFSMYKREVCTWDGEVRMKIFRDSHKSYLKYLMRLFNYHLLSFLCCCCYIRRNHFKKVYPSRRKPVTPPNLVMGTGTRFEVWHTPSGEVINVVEVTPEQIAKQTKHETDMDNYFNGHEIGDEQIGGMRI